jgi:pimeloyl-ACP methyl ester carboxylesterase
VRISLIPLRRRLLRHGSPRGTGARSLELLREAGVPAIAIDDAGHLPFLDRPDRFVEALQAFVERVVP